MGGSNGGLFARGDTFAFLMEEHNMAGVSARNMQKQKAKLEAAGPAP